MKVCILTTRFPRWPEDDRAPYILEAAKALKNEGLQVRVVTMHSPGIKLKEIWDGIEIVRFRYLPERLEILQEEGGGLPTMWQKKPWMRLAFLPVFLGFAWGAVEYSRDCAILHANWTLPGMACWATRHLHRRPYVVSVHGSDIYLGGQIPAVRWLTRLALNRAGKVISNSRALAEATVNLGVDERKLTIVNTGIDVNRFRPAEEPRNNDILYVGSFIRRKGVEFLLQALPEILRQHPQTRLVLVGDGPLKQEYLALVDQLDIHQNVEFTGWQSPEQVSERMRTSRLFVLPSINEAYGLVLLEALASGTPCIASQVDGTVEVITPEVGIFVPPGDASAISRAVNRLLSDPALYQQMSRAGRERAIKYFDWRLKAQQICEVYSQVLEKQKSTQLC